MFVLVPNELRDEINRLLDAEIAKQPDAEKDREHLFSLLLDYFDKHGTLPAFTLAKKSTP